MRDKATMTDGTKADDEIPNEQKQPEMVKATATATATASTTVAATTTTAAESKGSAAPASATDAVLKPSGPLPDGVTQRRVQGIDFDHYRGRDVTVQELVHSMAHTGFQATAVAEAVRIINDMRTWRDPSTNERTTIFLGYTSNLISSGLRETFRYLVQHRHVSAIVTTAGGVEEDLIKCLAPTYLGSFTRHSGAALRERGVNRIGNLYVPNSNYCAFEDWVIPILDRMLDEQEGTTTPTTNGQSVNGIDDHDEYDGEEEDEYGDDADSGGDGKGDSSGKRRRRVVWTPSKVIHRLGREIADPSSVCYWAARNRIPVFCPALTDGSLGDMLYFHTFRAAPRRLRIDIVSDIRRINSLAVHARRAGIIVLGGGLVKHHIANACLMRNGAEAAVYVNTAHEFDGSDAGARPDEAVSWGKIKADAAARGDAVKVHADASIIFPMLVAATFAAGDASSTSPPSPSPSPSSSQTPHNHEQ